MTRLIVKCTHFYLKLLNLFTVTQIFGQQCIINHYSKKDGMKNNSWCLETYKLSELHFLPPPTTPGLIPEGGGGGGFGN